MEKIRMVCVILSFAVLLAGEVSGQISLTGTHYSQDFNSIGSGLPGGWSVRTNATGMSLGTAVTFVTANTSWGSTIGQFANFASATNNDGGAFLGTESSVTQNACINRCLGIRQASAFGDPGAAFVLQLQNTLGRTSFGLKLDLTLLNVQGRSTVWTIDYGIGSNPGSFVPVGTFGDPGSFGVTNVTVSFGNALDNQNQNVWIRIIALGASAGSGSRDTFGIDNVMLTYGVLSPPELEIRLVGSDVVLTWDNASYSLQRAPELAGSYTNVPGATSPYTNPVTGNAQYFRLKGG